MDVKVNAVIPEETRESVRTMALSYGSTVQRIVAVLIAYGHKHITMTEIKRELRLAAKKSPTKQYRRTKPF